MVELLRAERPGDGVRGEEGAAVAGGGARSWLLDPVDGTLNYARGLPAWCSAACLVDARRRARVRGVRPGRGELFSAARGALAAAAPDGDDAWARRSWRRSSTCAGATTRSPRASSACCGASARCARSAAGRSSSLGSRAGRLDAWVQADVEPWDWHPGALLVAAAGGCVREVGRWRVAARSVALADELVACVGAGELRH